MNVELILFAISIIQISVGHPTSNESSYCTCTYENDQNLGPYINIDCKETVFYPRTCEHLKEYVNISSVSAVSFRHCEIAQFSDILFQFPNMNELAFLNGNTLPSVDFSIFEHLSMLMNEQSNYKTTLTSLVMNATNLELFGCTADRKEDITSISIENATELEHFNLVYTMDHGIKSTS